MQPVKIKFMKANLRTAFQNAIVNSGIASNREKLELHNPHQCLSTGRIVHLKAYQMLSPLTFFTEDLVQWRVKK